MQKIVAEKDISKKKRGHCPLSSLQRRKLRFRPVFLYNAAGAANRPGHTAREASARVSDGAGSHRTNRVI